VSELCATLVMLHLAASRLIECASAHMQLTPLVDLHVEVDVQDCILAAPDIVGVQG